VQVNLTMCKYKVIRDAVDWLGEHTTESACPRGGCRALCANTAGRGCRGGDSAPAVRA